MSPPPVGRRPPPDPDRADTARSWWLTAAFAAVTAVLSASYCTVWSGIPAGLLAVVTFLAVVQGRRAGARPAAASATATVAGLVAGAAVLSTAVVLAARR